MVSYVALENDIYRFRGPFLISQVFYRTFCGRASPAFCLSSLVSDSYPMSYTLFFSGGADVPWPSHRVRIIFFTNQLLSDSIYICGTRIDWEDIGLFM
jgi:hypothetical protein